MENKINPDRVVAGQAAQLDELEKKWEKRYVRLLQDMAENTVERRQAEEQIRMVIDSTTKRNRRTMQQHQKEIRIAVLIGLLALAFALAAYIGTLELSKNMTKAFERQEVSPPTITAAGQLLNPTGDEQITVSPQKQNGFSEAVPLTAEEQDWLRAAAEEFDVPYALALAVVETETDFRNIAGDGGASIGYLQVNAAYHTSLMESLGGDDLWHPRDNFRTGLCYLSQQLNTCDTVHKALMAYNMGPTGAAKAWGKGIVESGYSCKVMARMEHWETILGGGE